MPPLTIMVKPVSGNCNLRCSYCFYTDVARHRETASYGVMSPQTLETLVRRAFAYAEGQISFIFQGGEPTLAGLSFYRTLLDLEARCNTRGIAVHNAIQTNGWTIDEDWCGLFREGRFLVGVSLDGTRELHDACRKTPGGQPTYDRILENIALLRREKIDYNVLCVVNELIASQPEAVFDALKEHTYMQFIPCLDGFDAPQSEFSLKAETYGRFLIKTFDRYEQCFKSGKPVSIRTFDNWIGMLMGRPPESCAMSGQCGNYYLIEADGSVYPCDFYVLDRWRMGNINNDSFIRLERSTIGTAFRRESLPVRDECRACRWGALCRGGCKREREPIMDGVPSLNRLCAGHRMFFEARFERMTALARRLQK